MKYRKEIMQIHRLAVPILMNYALTSVFEIFDEMIIGHYSVESFAFVGVASSILYTITGAFGSLSAAFHILAAELYGMQEYGKMEQTFICGSKAAGDGHRRRIYIGRAAWRQMVLRQYLYIFRAGSGRAAFLFLSCIDHCLAKSDLVSVFRVFQESLWHKDWSVCHWTVCNCQFVF